MSCFQLGIIFLIRKEQIPCSFFERALILKKFTGQFKSNDKNGKLKSEKSFRNKCLMVKQRFIQI